MNDKKNPIPVLPLRDIVVFPNMIVRLFVGREKSVLALEEVMKTEQQIPQAMHEKATAGNKPQITTSAEDCRGAKLHL